jgi:hypothetical protein
MPPASTAFNALVAYGTCFDGLLTNDKFGGRDVQQCLLSFGERLSSRGLDASARQPQEFEGRKWERRLIKERNVLEWWEMASEDHVSVR